MRKADTAEAAGGSGGRGMHSAGGVGAPWTWLTVTPERGARGGRGVGGVMEEYNFGGSDTPFPHDVLSDKHT